MGRIVMVPMDPEGNNGATEAPAVITRVWSDTMVNVRIFGDNAVAAEWRTSVTLLTERPEDPKHVAWWPPRA